MTHGNTKLKFTAITICCPDMSSQFVIYKYIVNSSITQFLGTVLDTIMLSLKNHIDKLMGKIMRSLLRNQST